MKQHRWTDQDVKEFNRIISLMESSKQLNRIRGRNEWREFETHFTKDELDEMWKKVKRKKPTCR